MKPVHFLECTILSHPGTHGVSILLALSEILLTTNAVDLYKRISIFYLIGVLGSALSGVLALGFSKMNGLADYAGWRWIFIMEGLLTCVIGLTGYIFMVNFPSQSHKAWGSLSASESAYIVRRLNRDRGDADTETDVHEDGSLKINWRAFFVSGLDWKVWGFALSFLYVPSLNVVHPQQLCRTD